MILRIVMATCLIGVVLLATAGASAQGEADRIRTIERAATRILCFLGVAILLTFCSLTAFSQTSPRPISTKTQVVSAMDAKLAISKGQQKQAIPTTLEEIVDPAHTVVIVHEMIGDIVARYKPEQIERLLGSIQPILASAREKRVRIIYVRFTQHADGSTFSDPIRRKAFRGEPGAEMEHIEGTPGWEVIDAVKPHPEDLVLRKYRPDAFYGTILDSVLRWNGVKTVVFVGLGVAVGGVPTLSTASNLGYFPVAVTDALISSDAKQTTDALAYVTDTSQTTTHTELIDAWKSAKPRPLAVPLAPLRAQDEPPSLMYEGRTIPMTTEEILNPSHTAVLVQGIQRDFISPGGGCDLRGCRYDPKEIAAILPSIKEVIAAARRKNIPVVFLRTTSLSGDLTSSDFLRRQRASAGGPPSALAVEGTPGWEFIDELRPAKGDIVVPVYRPDAFFGTPLDPILKCNGVKTVVYLGINADTAAVQTLTRAWYLGYFRVLVSDATLSGKTARLPFTTTYLNSALPSTSRGLVNIWSRRRREEPINDHRPRH
jgi:nicotinamidase-related amidase